MPYERIILDERLDASKEDIERLSSEFFSQYIYLAYKIEISFDFNGDKQIWVIKPEDRSDGQPEKLINGYLEISSISLDQKTKPVDVRIASCREELNLLWLELSNYIKSGILLTDFPPSLIARQLTEDILSGESESKDGEIQDYYSSRFTPKQKKQIDQACIDWAGRGYLPMHNMDEFLTEFSHTTGIYISKDQFKGALKDAGNRNLIVKRNRRWRTKENPP